MFERHQHASRCVYLLADSLDSILAACEDLLSQHSEPSHLLRLELAAVTHVLQARRYIDELDESEPTLIDQCVLFLTGTAALDLEHLRSGRSSQPAQATGLSISDDYMIARQMPLRVLAQLAGALLDALEAHFVLYGDELGTPVATRATHHEDRSEIGVQLWGHATSFGS
jgi:hypothetical protein